ncbi:MAG TPA: hypothetical protein DF296_00805 [Candidatus Margulisbacteria bacterium]|nr:MAG: hypothetical protein A2X42_10440 [Candidatus Margulisbacteria bacterium GWF2_38_17]OGI07108.1 MAG: hypothetical protein A2X41_12740 [Candidatus Margulisbacteria bacterium GWE2_39_32]HCT83721.1 hypothetical protein [Candidatus Margulisiibacteriota bacterium]
MKRNVIFLVFIILLVLATISFAANFNYVGKEELYRYSKLNDTYPPLQYQLIREINDFKVASYINNGIGNLYISHGCVHISPATSFILYSILPLNATVYIKGYNLNPPDNLAEIAELTDLVNSNEDIQNLKYKCSDPTGLKLVLYPQKAGILFLNNKAFAKFNVMSGPEFSNYPLQGKDEKGLVFDKNYAEPTPEGMFRIFKKTDYFYASLYPDTSLLKQDCLMVYKDNKWKYWDEDKQLWASVPVNIAEDLARKDDSFTMLFYEIKRDKDNNIISARWGGHPFGKHALMLMDDKNVITSILIHTNGQLLLEEQEMLYYITDMIISDKEKTWDEFVESHQPLIEMRYITDFIQNPQNSSFADNKSTAFFKLANNLSLSAEEKLYVPDYYYLSQRVTRATKYKMTYAFSSADKRVLSEWRISQDKMIYPKFYGIYYDIFSYDLSFRKSASWYNSLRITWDYVQPLKQEFMVYFDKNNIESPIDRGKVCFSLLSNRLRFGTVSSLYLWLFLKGM